MGLIGDIYYAFRGDGARLQKDATTEGQKAGAGLAKSTAASFKKSWSGANIGKGFIQGLGLAGGLGAVGLITGAIAKVGDVLGDAKDAALAEEKSIQRLGTTLRANVPNWDGYTKGIERTLKQQMALGFSDDEQRESLARIVIATKNVSKALNVQRVAMDLARLKGISLMEASEALVKVEGGQFRALKALGIQLPKNATATEALAAVTAAAAGQAEDFAKTSEGRLLISQVKVGEAMEELGALILPAFITATEVSSDVIVDLSGNLDGVTQAADIFGDVMENLGIKTKGAADEGFDFIHAGQDLLAVMNPTKVENTVDMFLNIADAIGVDTKAVRGLIPATDDSIDAVEDLRAHATADLSDTGDALVGVGEAAGEMEETTTTHADGTAKSIDEMKDDIVDDAQELIDDAFDPIIAHDRLIAVNAEIASAKRIIASGKASKAEIRDARATLNSARKDQAELLLTLARAGQTGSKAFKTGIKELRENIKNSTGPTKKYLQDVLDKLLKIDKLDPKVTITVRTYNKAYKDRFLAEGGTVRAGEAVIVGERRPELFVPDTRGRILPRVPSRTAVGGGTNNVTVNLNGVGSDVSTQTARRFGQSVLDVVADGLREQTARIG